MAIEKGLYSAPEGLEDRRSGRCGRDGHTELEIEIVDPEVGTLS